MGGSQLEGTAELVAYRVVANDLATVCRTCQIPYATSSASLSNSLQSVRRNTGVLSCALKRHQQCERAYQHPGGGIHSAYNLEVALRNSS